MKTTYAFVSLHNDTVFVIGLYDQKLPFSTIVFPMPINIAIAILCVDHYTLGASQVASNIQEGFNTPHRYERRAIPKAVRDNQWLEGGEFFITTIETDGNCYDVGILQDSWSFLAFVEKDDNRDWFHFNLTSPDRGKWMELKDLANFTSVYSEVTT